MGGGFLYQLEVRERTDILRKLVDELLQKYASGFYFSTDREILQTDYFLNEPKFHKHQCNFLNESPHYGLVVYDEMEHKLKCRAGGITLKMLSEMVLCRYMEEEAPHIGDYWPGNEVEKLNTMQHYVKNIIKNHTRVRSVERNVAYLGYNCEKHLSRKKPEDTKDFTANRFCNCFGEPKDSKYSSIYTMEDKDFSDHSNYNNCWEQSDVSPAPHKIAVVNCYMLDIPYSLDTYQRIPKNRWHPSLYPQISLVTLKTITQKKEDNWFYLSAPICTQWGFYFSPTSQTVEDANIWTKNTYNFIAWHMEHGEVDHIQLIPFDGPAPEISLKAPSHSFKERNTWFDNSQEIVTASTIQQLQPTQHTLKRGQTPFSDACSLPEQEDIQALFSQWNPNALPQICKLPPDWKEKIFVYNGNCSFSQMEFVQSNMRLVCPKQRKHGIAITNEKMYYDTDNQKLFLDSDESAAMLLPVGQFSRRIVDTAGKAGIV